MLPGPDQVVACPRCGWFARHFTLMSGNTFGARVWTDGKQVAPMLPGVPPVAKCLHCKAFYWLSEAEQVGTVNDWDSEEEFIDPAWAHAKDIEELSESEYHSAIESSLARNREQERILRILAWWRGNDAFRDDLGTSGRPLGRTTDRFRDNLLALVGLFDTSNTNEILMKAESYRELGEFKAATAILDQVRADDLADAARQMCDLCYRGDTLVRPLRFRRMNSAY